MPRGDQTGPLGEGPMTGRAFGYCAGYDRPGFTAGPRCGPGSAAGFGAGFGRRRGGRGPGFGRSGFGGRGMAWGRPDGMGYPPAYGAWGAAHGEAAPEAPVSKENRKEAIQGEVEALEERLRFLKREMDALDEEGEQQ